MKHIGHLFTFLLIWILAQQALFAGEYLLKIGGKEVSKEEFTYIYQKNNINQSADFSRKSLEDYLQLFINYKLKVREAIDMGMDTVPELVAEYNSYEQQLFDAYINRQIIDPLVQQSYERSKSDIGVSHIFISANTPDAKKTIKEVHDQLLKGVPFEELAKKYSQDDNSAPSGGRIGYFTSLQIGFPQLEDAAYNTPKDQYSEPIETPLGYHILKVFDVRPARGRVRVAIIKRIIPEDPADAAAVEKLVDSLYQAAKKGADFGELATRFSEDQLTNLRAGEMDWFGINTYTAAFEDAAFSLTTDGEISVPIKTNAAWYIIKRLMATRQLSFEEAEPVIRTRLQKSRLFNYTMERFIENLKQTYRFKEYEDNALQFRSEIEAYVNKFPFKYQSIENPLPILSINGKIINSNDLGKVVNKIANKVVGKVGAERSAGLYEEAVKQVLMDALKTDLPVQNPEYGALLEEYRNGVLIFDLTRNRVWNKAVTDSIGLASYFKANRNKYMWNQRYEGFRFTARTAEEGQKLNALYKKMSKASLEEWQQALQNAELPEVGIEKIVLEKSVSEDFDKYSKQSGLHSQKNDKGETVFYYFYKELPPSQKELSECRGFVIAAYQEYLDKSWISELRSKYDVQINTEVFEQLVKK